MVLQLQSTHFQLQQVLDVKQLAHVLNRCDTSIDRVRLFVIVSPQPFSDSLLCMVDRSERHCQANLIGAVEPTIEVSQAAS